MEHREYIRHIPGSKFAVLMIHGIAGTPNHFNPLLPQIPEDWSVYNILLDGHGKQVEDFSATSMEKWKNQVKAQLETIFARHEKVVLIAHSMGTLFSLQAAMDHPDRIPCLFLLNVPTRPQYPPATMAASVRVAWGKVSPKDRRAWEMQNAASVNLSRNYLKYFGWIPRMWELLTECRRVRKLLPQLQTPTYTFQSRSDELVSFRSVKDLEGHPYINNTVLEHSGHFAYREPDLTLLQQRLQALLEEVNNESIGIR